MSKKFCLSSDKNGWHLEIKTFISSSLRSGSPLFFCQRIKPINLSSRSDFLVLGKILGSGSCITLSFKNSFFFSSSHIGSSFIKSLLAISLTQCAFSISLPMAATYGKTFFSTSFLKILLSSFFSDKISRRKFMMCRDFSTASFHNSGFSFMVSAGSLPNGTTATFMSKPSLKAISIPLSTASKPASSLSKATIILSVRRFIILKWSAVRAVPETATVFVNPA